MAHRDIYGEWDPITGNIPIAHPAGKVIYNSVWGLYVNDHHYDGHVATYIPRTALTKTGRVAKKQPPKPQKKPWTYWKAQCVFRGLSPKGSIAQLQERLHGYEAAPVIEEFRAIEEQAKRNCLARSSQVLQSARASQASQEAEDLWSQNMSDEEKASTNLRRYLVETFLVDGETPEAVVIQGDNSSGQRWALGVQKTAQGLGLRARIVEVTPDPDEAEVADRRWVVVGAKKPTVVEAAATVMETTEGGQEDQENQNNLQSDPASDEEETEGLRELQRELEAALDACEDWDVTGTYQISCPYIEEQWGHLDHGDGLTLRVYRADTPKGPQMYAKFDFMVATGIFRFERHKRDTKPAIRNGDRKNKRRRREQGSDDEIDEDNIAEEVESDYDDGESRSPTPEAFYLGSVPRPSAQCHSWHYRWRGQDTGTTEIQLGSDQRPFEVKWYGPRVDKLKGTFGADFIEDCSFTGIKVGLGADLENIDIAEEWADRNERAHTRASRW